MKTAIARHAATDGRTRELPIVTVREDVYRESILETVAIITAFCFAILLIAVTALTFCGWQPF